MLLSAAALAPPRRPAVSLMPAWSHSFLPSSADSATSWLSTVVARPVIDRGLVLAVSHSGRFAAVELRSGGRVWDREIASQHMPWVAGDYVYILTTSGDVLCLTRRDGRIRWVQTLPRYENPEKEKDPITWSGPALAGDRLIVVGSSGDAIALSPYTGQAMGRLELKGKTLISPVVADDTLLILTDDGDLVAYR